MAKKVFTDESLSTLITEIKSYTDDAVSTKANSSHTHTIANVTNLQSTLDGKANSSHTHTVSQISDLTATATELNYVDGVTSSIQTQLNAKVPTSRTINGKALSSNVTLSASDVGASSTSHEHSASKITSGILAVERGGTGNLWGYIQVGAEEGTSIGALATAEGRKVTASGDYCHAEGNYTEASGSSAHAEGQSSIASGIASHAEGNNATASGNYSHAEGDSTNASAKGAHAEGTYTLASSDYQHVQGRFNIEDKTGTYAHIVGNGTGTSNSARSNAHTLDWDGNAWFAGNVYIGGTSQNDASQAASVASYTATIGTTWTGSAAPYTQDIAVTGITANDKPVVDLTFSGTYATDQARLADWGKIYRIVTAANKITVYATAKTTASLPIQLQVVR